MEDISKKIIEKQFQDLNRIEEEATFKEKAIKGELAVQKTSKNIEDLKKEEETLTSQLEGLKKENFALRTSITAWQLTLRKKLEEFNKADLKLNEIYNKIWSERENFCSKAEKFNDERGILSDWWKKQIKYVSDLEDLGKKREDDKKHQQEIDRLQKEIKELKKEIEDLERPEIGTQDGDSIKIRSKKTTEETTDNNHPEGSTGKKKVRFLEEDKIEVFPCPNNELYSMVDVEKVRKAARIRNRGKPNFLYGKVKKLLGKKSF